MQIKKRYFVIALVLLLGLTTFSFANPKEEMGSRKTAKGISETVTNDIKENNSYSEALEAVEEAEENPTEETVETARNEIRNANDATEEQVQNLQQRVDVVEETIDVAALVKEVEVLAEVKETREQAKSKYPNAETEVNKLDEGEVKNNLENRLAKVSRLLNDTNAPEVTGIDENVPTNKNEIIYVKDEFLASVIIDETEYTDFIVEGDILKFEKKVTTEGTHTVTAKDKLGNTTTKTFMIDKTEAKKNAVNANVNGYDNKVNEQYATNGKKVTAYITLTEELRENPTFTFYANGKEIKKVKDEVVASASTNAKYPYKYTAVLEINEELAAEDGELTYTVTNMYDVAGNQTPDITKLSVTGKVLKLDRTPNRVTFTTISTDNKNVEGKVYYVTEGDTITFRMGVREKFSVNPTITIGGKEVTLEYVKYFPSPNHHEYRGTIKLDDTFKDGNLNIIITGSKDIAGNTGFYYQTNGKKVLETITTKETTNGKSLVYDNTAPSTTYVMILSKGANHKYATNGDTIRFLVRFTEEVVLSDEFAVTFNNVTKPLVRSGDKAQIEYIAEFKISKEEKNLAEGPLTFEIKGFKDKLGNASNQVVTTTNHYKYNEVTYDRTAPVFVEETGYNENGINPYIKLADKNDISFKVYRKGTEKPIHEFDSTTVGKSFKIGWHGGGFYTIVATDAAGNTTSKEFEVYHVIDSIDDLKNVFKNGGKAILTKNITLDTAVEVAEGKKLEIDLNGYELKISNPEKSSTRLINNKGDLSIKNGSLINEKIHAYGIVDNYGTLTIDNVEFRDNGSFDGSTIKNRNGKVKITNSKFNIISSVGYKTDEKEKNVKFGNAAVWSDGELVIKNTNINSDSERAYSLIVNSGKSTIENVNAKGKHGGLAVTGGTVTINDMKYESDVHYGIYVSNKSEANVTINGGKFIGQLQGLLVYNEYDKADVKVTVNGGTFSSKTGKEAAKVSKGNKELTHKMELIIKGGTFVNTELPEEYIADGYRQNAEGRVVKENAISTQAEMVSAISEGGKFELDTDLTLTDASLKVAKNKDVEINLNGKTITARSTTSSASNAIEVLAGGNLKLTGNGKIEFTAGSPDTDWGEGGSKPYPGYASNTIVNRGTLVIDGPTIVNNTEYGGATYAVDAYAGSKLTLISGEISAPYNRAIRMFTSSETPSTDVTIKGGKVTGNIPLYVHVAGSNSSVAPTVNLNISGGEIGTIDGWSLYTYSYGNSFKNINVTITGGEFYGSVAFSGGKKVDKENVSITGGTFHSDLGRYLANDGWEDIAKPAQ